MTVINATLLLGTCLATPPVRPPAWLAMETLPILEYVSYATSGVLSATKLGITAVPVIKLRPVLATCSIIRLLDTINV